MIRMDDRELHNRLSRIEDGIATIISMLQQEPEEPEPEEPEEPEPKRKGRETREPLLATEEESSVRISKR